MRGNGENRKTRHLSASSLLTLDLQRAHCFFHNVSVVPALADPFSTFTRDPYLLPRPLAPPDELVLFEPDPPVDPLIGSILILGMSTGAPRVIVPSVRLSGSWLILYDGWGCGLMEPSDPTSLGDPVRLFD